VKICTFPGCDRKHKGHGLCSGHYQQHRKARPLTPLDKQTQASWIAESLKTDTDRCVLVPWQPNRSQASTIVNGQRMNVGAAALTLSGSPRPVGKVCCHDPLICNNGRCVNIRHIRWGTAAENEADKVIAGTHNRGERHSMVKLTEDQIIRIRALRGQRLQRETATEYGISQTHVSQIQRGARWKHLSKEQYQ